MGNSHPIGDCMPGYYCSGNAMVPTQYEVQPGYFSHSAASNQTACYPGTYSMEHLQSICLDCEAGYYCPISGLSSYSNYICDAGHYCPPNTINPLRCPSGKFSPTTGNIDLSNCTPCTTGYYCEMDGLQSVTGPCDAGYYCTIGARSKVQAHQTSEGGPCPAGYYCMTGSGKQ